MSTEDAARTAPAASSGPSRISGESVFAGLTRGAGLIILAALFLVALFLMWQGWPALTAGSSMKGMTGDVTQGAGFWGYVGPLAFGTVWIALIALVIATPLSLGIALFISHYAPRRVASLLGYIIDLLAAVPSIVFGLWGVWWLAGKLKGPQQWLFEHASWFPLFGGDQPAADGRTSLLAGIVLAIMILPIMTAVNREVFLQTPRLHQEASLALGATRWEMIRQAVLPFARSGIISGMMLGLGRALGETMAVYLVLSPRFNYSTELLTNNSPSTIASNIALGLPNATGIGVSTLIATGLVLFALTLGVNMLARWIVSRRSAFSGAN